MLYIVDVTTPVRARHSCRMTNTFPVEETRVIKRCAVIPFFYLVPGELQRPLVILRTPFQSPWLHLMGILPPSSWIFPKNLSLALVCSD